MAIKVDRRGLGGNLDPRTAVEKSLSSKSAQNIQTQKVDALRPSLLDGAVSLERSIKPPNTEGRIRDSKQAKVVADDVSDEIKENDEKSLEAHEEVERVAARQHLLN